jgi:C1q-related factor
METAVGVVDVKSSPVYFHVQRNSSYTLDGTTIPFETERLNVGGGMNIASGIFTVPKSGIYFFSFSGINLSPASSLAVDLYHNSNLITPAIMHTNTDGWFTVSLSSMLSLKSGDQISLRLIRGQLWDNQFCYTNFNGMLLQEEMLS